LSKLGFGGKKKEKKTPNAEGDTTGNAKLDDGQIGSVETFTVGKETHRLWIESHGEETTVMIASNAANLTTFLNSNEVKAIKDTDGHVAAAKELQQSAKQEADLVAKALTKNEDKNNDAGAANKADAKTENLEDQLVPHLQWIFK